MTKDLHHDIFAKAFNFRYLHPRKGWTDDNKNNTLLAGREHLFSNSIPDVEEPREVTKEIIRTVRDTLKLELRPIDPFDTNN